MYVTTQGIVLRRIPYKNKLIISNIYTKEYGLVAFMIKKTKEQVILSQPLNIVEITYRHSRKNKIHYVVDCSPSYIYKTLNTNGQKMLFAMFISEVLNKCLREKSIPIYQFIVEAFKWLDGVGSYISGFDSLFLIKFCEQSGIQPSFENVNTQLPFVLNMIEGKYVNNRGQFFKNKNIIPPEQSKDIFNFSKITFDDLARNFITIKNPNAMLDHLIKYISIHLVNISNLKSLKVYKELI